MDERAVGRKMSGHWGARAIGACFAFIGLWLGAGGAWLAWLGGSPYYLLCGVGCLAVAACYFSGRERVAFLLYMAVFAATCLWALGEVGPDFWPLLPRVAGPAVFAAIAAVRWCFVSGHRRLGWSGAALSAIALALLFVGITRLPTVVGGQSGGPVAAAAAQDWPAFGQSPGGMRFSPAAQIRPDNVGSLRLAWSFRTGDMPGAYPRFPKAPHSFQATPLQVGNLVYVCSQHDIVFAIDADTGKLRWRHDPRIDQTGVVNLACRGVSYADTGQGQGPCAKRIIQGTLDARLIALDALTGQPCAGFGRNGEVQLRDGMGVLQGGFYTVTSPPAVANGVAVVGGFVMDGVQTDVPSGVVRGYEVVTGKLLWSWDSGARDENRLPPPGQVYTRGSPNVWSVMSADPQLGLVYLPTGNATPDYVGMHRSREEDRYSSSVVALDIRTGRRRWHFQTVHHDLWDYDIGSQPVLFDMPMPDGRTVPALAQPTKQGEIFILDRRTGKPLTPVAERPVPRGTIPEERYSATQPASIGFPSPLTKTMLRESDMWGATPLDQLVCRIWFRSARNEGRFTPPATVRTVQYPANLGAMDWGSVSIGDHGRTMFVNSAQMATIVRLIGRTELAKDGPPSNLFFSPQTGTPYAADPQVMISPLGIPCNAPPWGMLTAIDLQARRIKWQHPFGTSRDMAPLGIAVPGAPNIGGSVATGGGLLFIGAAVDDYLRAFDVRTGAELWRRRLPAGGQAAPISYVSGRSGRQYIVIAAGGHHMLGTTKGDYVMAFALPQR